MFKFLKEKLKSAISKISEGVEKEGKIEEKIIEKSEEPPREEKGFFAKLKEKFSGKEEIKVQPSVDELEETVPKIMSKNELEALKKTTENKEIAGSNYSEFLNKTEKMHYDKKFYEKSQKNYEKNLKETKQEIPRYEAKKVHEHPIKKIEEKSIKQEPIKETPKKQAEEKPKEEVKKIEEAKEEKKGFFAAIKEKIITTKIGESQFEKLFWEMEMALMENNVAMEVIEKIKNDLKGQLVEKPIKRTKVEETILETLKGSIGDLFEKSTLDLMQEIKNKEDKPYVIAFFGINGSGKTTSIAKIAKMMKDGKISCILAASDTFRAASIEQLQQHADRIGVRIIKHDYGADPAAVAFDAIKHAKAKNIDAVLIDTAGRMHSNQNLIDELKKITRVTKPDLKIFVGEAIAGNDCIEQAKTFNDAVGIDGIILAKADIDEKGGAAVSVSYVTKKPILFLGTGQNYSDIEPFSKEKIMKNIGLV